jgi:hypothetical protein
VYRVTRRIQVHPGKMQEALGVTAAAVGHLNAKLGGAYSYAVNVGGDPNVIGIAASYEHLADYDKMRSSLAGDSELQEITASGAALTASTHDAISKVIVPAGPPTGWLSVNTARMHMPRVVEAITFGVEICEYVTKLTGRPLGLTNATTGDRSRIFWGLYVEDLAQLEAIGDQTEGDAGYMDLFSRSAGLFVDGSLEASIWQRLG